MGDRVLHCYADYKWTGPSEPVVRLCRELSDRGWPSDLVCMDPPRQRPNTLAEGAEAAGVTAFQAFTQSDALHVVRFRRDRPMLRSLVAEGGYSLVHCHGSWDHLVAGWRRRAAGLPPVLRSDHGAREYTRRPLQKLIYGRRMLDHLIVLSERYAVQAVDRLGLDVGGVSTVRGAVDTDSFRPIEPPAGMRAEMGLSDDDVVIGVVSRVQPHRRFHVLIEAATRVRKRNPRVKIVVCGRGTRKAELLDRPVERGGLRDTVIALGYVQGNYMETLATFDAGLMLVPGSDGSCRAAMEMAAMGKPMLVADRGVLPDLVRDGETGIVVRDEPILLANAILEMASDADLRARWGAAGRERMCALFSPGRQAEEVAGVYGALR